MFKLRTAQRGFTLIELMIVVAVIAILAAIALPSYQDSVRKSRRADAKSALMQLAQFMERNYSIAQRYDKVDPAGTTNITLPFTKSPIDGGASYYTLSLSAVAQNAFTLQAVPQGAQATDVCGDLTIDNAGGKTSSGTGTGCW